MAIKTIDYKANNEAYFKALKAPQEVGRAINGATLLAVENSDTYAIYYTFDGKIAFRVMMYSKNIDNLDSFDDLKERVKQDFGKLDDTLVDKVLSPHEELLADIQERIDNKEWTTNGDALFCEYCNKPELAADVIKNRAEYIAQKEGRERIKRIAYKLLNDCDSSALFDSAWSTLCEVNLYGKGTTIFLEVAEFFKKYGFKVTEKGIGWEIRV